MVQILILQTESKRRKVTINPKNKDHKCSQYAAVVTYPSKMDYWKKFEKNHSTIVLNVLYTEEMEICPAYISKSNSNR